MFVDDLFNKKTLTEAQGGGSPWHSEPEQQMDADRRGRLGRERNAGLDEPDDAPSGSAPTGNGVYEYTVPAGQESVAQELGLQQHRGHWVSRVPIQRANFQFGRPQFHEILSQGVAEGAQDFNKIKTSYDQASRMFSGEETQGFTIEVLLPNEAVFEKIQDTFKMFEKQIGTYLIEKEDSIEGNGIGALIISPLRQGARNAQRSYNQILDLIQKSRGQFNKSTGVTIYKQTQGVAEGKKHRINEAVLMEDPVYRKFKVVGRYIAERRMSEKEILQVFADAETGMTDKGTGANRTMLGRGKDNTMAFAGSVKDAVTSVLSSIQNSVPVSAVDVAYDQATDALAGLSGGQRGKVMQAIKGYRNLVKEYPKTAGFAKAALVAIAGLATGGAGLPAIAGLTYALDSAIRGDKLSSVLGKGVGAAAVTWGGQQVAGALKGTTPAVDSSVSAADSLGPGETIPGTGSEGGKLLSWSQGVGPGDTLSSLAKQYNVSVDELLKANPQITNPDVLQVGSSIQIPTNNFQGDQWGSGLPTYDKGVGTSADTMAKIKTGQYTDSPISQALAKKVRESVKFKMLPAEKLIDRQGTIMSWALQESIGVKRKSVNLTTTGAYTVFENIDRYRQAIMEKAGVPGSTRPAYYRPDMPDGPGKASKPGIVGRGLNWLDKTAGKVGGALSNFGHQFTTNVTKEKLKMNWHQAGKPSDSDQLAAFLTKQGVPQEVVATVYGKMSIPYTAPVVDPKAQTATDPAVTAKSGIQTGATALIDPDTKRPYEKDKLAAMYGYKDTAAVTPPAPVAPGATGATSTTTTGTTPSFNAGNVMKLPGMEKYAKPAPAVAPKTANFAGPTGYAKTTTSFKPPAAPSSPALAVPSVPKVPRVTAGGPTPAEKANLAKRIAASAPAVAETLQQIDRMLESVTSKKSAEIIKTYADQQFAKLGLSNTTECKQIMAHVVHESAVRRRAYAQRMAK